VRAAEYPVGNVAMAMRPEKVEADVVECFIDAHVASSRGSMVGGENVAAK
jgi:hypothetical protein